MILEIKIPSPGESITEVELGRWLVEDGALVKKGQEIAEVESDKATLTLIAGEGGKVTIKIAEGQTAAVDDVACLIDTSIQVSPVKEEIKQEEIPESGKSVIRLEDKVPVTTKAGQVTPAEDFSKVKVTSVAQEMMKEQGLTIEDVISGLKRIGKKEVESVILLKNQDLSYLTENSSSASREVTRAKMSMLRRKLSERLVSVKNETAMLTTFNEIDMKAVMELRTGNQQKFTEKHGYKLGFMSFFAKAVAVAAQAFPMVNSMIEGDEIVTPEYVDVGIAVSTPKGLMVPVVRNAESKSIARIEKEIKDLAEKARNKKISVEELTGGTITITNGGVFGSLLSTPIINPPQSAILGMHNIVDRPVAVDGQVLIRPMMYVALSYDHRIIDGKDSVSYLVRVKELIENPERMLTGGEDPFKLLLNL